MRTLVKISLLSVFLSFLFTACDPGMVYDQYIHFESQEWSWEEPANFTFTVEDTSTFNNILIKVRHSTDYPLSNLYMFVHITGPSGQSLSDTLNFKLAESDGEWIGKGVGDIREIAYLYRKDTRFPEPGDYSVELEQAMRRKEVPVREVGIRVERVKP